MPVFSLKLTILWFLKFDSYPHRPEKQFRGWTNQYLDHQQQHLYTSDTNCKQSEYDPTNHNPSPKKPAGPVMSVRLFPLLRTSMAPPTAFIARLATKYSRTTRGNHQKKCGCKATAANSSKCESSET